MQKISDSTNTANSAGEFTEGNPAAGVDATLLKAQWLNVIQRELVALVLGANIKLSAADDTQVLKAVMALTGSRVIRDGITYAGFASNDPNAPYMRRESDDKVYFLQPSLGFKPVQQGTGVGQQANTIRIGYSSSGVRITVDTVDYGNLWYSGNFDPNSKANWGATLAAYGIADAFTKTEAVALAAQRVARDGITYAGFASNDPNAPYMRRESDDKVYFLQPSLGFKPVQQGTGVGQQANAIKIGYSSSGVRITVDTVDYGNLWYSGNFDPNSKANWGSTLAAYGIIDSYTKTESDTRLGLRIIRDSITYAGFASNDVAQPYFRRESDDKVYFLQPNLGFTPVRQGGGAGQGTAAVRIGWSATGEGLKAQVDNSDLGSIWVDNYAVPKAIAAQAQAGAGVVGSYALLLMGGGNANIISPGTLIPGASSYFASVDGLARGATPAAGTWRVMGSALNADGGQPDSTTLCLRVS